MARKPSISNEARAKVLLELKDHPNGYVVTELNRRLGWRKRETKKVLDDLLESGMAYADHVSPWVMTHKRDHLLTGEPWLHKLSPKGTAFLEYWSKLEELSSTKDSYSEIY